MEFETILVEKHDRVGLIRLNRPKALNALNSQLLRELASALVSFDKDIATGAVVVTGSEKAFAAGADIREMHEKSYMDAFLGNLFAEGDAIAKTRKPVIAAVAGYALGGGCELAMMCDFIIAADNAQFGQPEITLGVMPGMGGSQRLARAVGKAKAMDMCLTGRMMDVHEAERSGLVARIVPLDRLLDEALAAAKRVAELSLPAVIMTKEAVNRSQEISLSEGLLFERRVFQSMFALEDQKEGMAAFVEKRKASFSHR